MTETGYAHVPHPGSRLDAVAQAAEHETPPQTGAQDYKTGRLFTVATRSDMPEETVPRTLVLSSANPYLAALPRDMQRRRAVLLAIDNDVVLAESKELAQAIATLVAAGAAASTLTGGFYLSKGVPLPLESRDWMFAAATTTATASRLSVVVERYAYPLPD